MTSTSVLVSVEDYLASLYEPDVDYVDGELEDRNVGEKDHAKMQYRVMRLFDIGELFATFETRIKVSVTRYRVPDVCAYETEPKEQVFLTAPLVIVEVLSPKDRMSRMQRKLEDYFEMGCRNIWILDPKRFKAYRYDGKALVEVQDRLSVIELPHLTWTVPEIFRKV